MENPLSIQPIVVPYDAVRAVFPLGNLTVEQAASQNPRWNQPDSAGTPVALTYHFSDSHPLYPQTSYGYVNASAQPWSAAQKATMKAVMDAYSKVANISFTEVSSQEEAHFGFFLSNSITPSGFATYPGTVADKGTQHGDVVFGVSSFPATGSNAYLAFHEFGHALGLAHLYDAGSKPTIEDFGLAGGRLLSVVDQGQLAKPHYLEKTETGYAARTLFHPEGPMLLDILALQLLYGPNLTTGAGDDVYTFDVDPNFYRTLWDAGGHDTIDLSNQKHPSLIALEPGVYSSIGLRDPFEGVPQSTREWALNREPDLQKWNDGSNSLVIAFGTVIEDVIGSPVTDVLIGNSAANRLDGRGGDDHLSGLAGNDILLGGEGNDRLEGGEGDDVLDGGAGDDFLDGGTGLDIALYGGPRAAHGLTRSTDGSWRVESAASGTDQLVQVERVRFSDGAVALDLDSNAGDAARLLGLVLDAQALRDPGLAGFALHHIDALGLEGAARLLVDSGTLAQLAGGDTPSQVIGHLYRSLFNQSPAQAEVDALLREAHALGFDQADMVVFAAHLEQNAQNIDLVGLSGQGLAYNDFLG